ncbi:hypothetical protein HDU79_003932 [Rhizoclosmatium sp. JEL0117]|nr:hypothetical protein HDU79_003932 [Rhizoclosmatium sp. JEL0117]
MVELNAELLDQVDAYLQLQSEIGQLLRKGFMHLAEAKYILGPLKLSQHSYSRKMEATAFCLQIASAAEPTDISEQIESLTVQEETSTIRRRKKETKEKEQSVEGEVELTEEEKEAQREKEIEEQKKMERAERLKNPLYMLGGALPPRALREAQTAFKEALGKMLEAKDMYVVSSTFSNVE